LQVLMMLASILAAAIDPAEGHLGGAEGGAAPTLPSGWQAAIDRGDMLHRRLSNIPDLDPRLRPSIGNGFLATLAGSGSTYLAGVFNVRATWEPFRARLPGLAAIALPWHHGGQATVCAAQAPANRTPCGTPPYTPADGCTAAQGCCYGSFSPDPHSLPWCYQMVNASSCTSSCDAPRQVALTDWATDEALDMARGVFLRAATFSASAEGGAPGDGNGAENCSYTVLQRTYAHRARRSLLVTDFVLDATSCAAGFTIAPLQAQAGPGANTTAQDTQDFDWVRQLYKTDGTAMVAPSGSVFAGRTKKAEQRGRTIGAAFAALAPVDGALVNLTVVAGRRAVVGFPNAFVTDVNEDTATPLAALAANASAELDAALAVGSPDALFAEHVLAMSGLRQSRIEVEGDPALARLVNVTTYSLSASLAAGVHWSTSPGGLSTGGRWANRFSVCCRRAHFTRHV